MQILICLALLVLHCGAEIVYRGPADKMRMVPERTVLLGGLFPVHSNGGNNLCGGILDLGVQRLEAMVLATQLINRSPKLLPEVTLAFEIRDTCVQANLALEESLNYISARSVVNSSNTTYDVGVSGVVGAASSSVSIAVANLLRLFQVPQISYASTAKILSDKTRFDYFFRTVPPDSLQTRAMADIVENFNWTYIHAINSADAYGEEGIGAFIEQLRTLNSTQLFCIASRHELPARTSDEDFAIFDRAVGELDQAWVSNSSVVVLFGQLSTAKGLLGAVKRRDAIEPGFAQRFTWIGSDAWGDQLPAELHSVASGMLSVSPKSMLSEEFDRYFTSLHPSNISNPWFEEYWESWFNCSFTMTNEKLRQCDPNRDFISSENGYTQNSKVPFTIDAVYAFAHAIHNMISDLCPDNLLCDDVVDQRLGGVAVKGELLREYLYNVSFHGTAFDLISFDSSGDEEGEFVIKNLKRSPLVSDRYFYDDVGVWSHTTFLDLYGRIEWNTGEDVPVSVCSLPCGGGEFSDTVPGQSDCCWTCRPCLGSNLVSTGLDCSECEPGFRPSADKTECIAISPMFLQWTNPWAIIVLIAISCGLIATGFVITMFVVCHNHHIIKASSRELSGVLLLGVLICYIMPLFFIAQPSIPICIIRRFGVGFAFSVCYSALLVKTNRIHRIFNQSTSSLQKPPLISPKSQMFFTFLLVSVQVVIAVIWLVVERPTTAVVYSGFEGELKCGESVYVSLPVTLGYNLILLLLSTYYAFRSRNIPQNFNEAKFINVTLYTTCIIWLAFVSTYFATVKLGTVYQTTSLILSITLSATTTLCCLFMPKMYFLFSQRGGEKGDGLKKNTLFSDQNNLNNVGDLGRRESIAMGLCVTSSIADELGKVCHDKWTQTEDEAHFVVAITPSAALSPSNSSHDLSLPPTNSLPSISSLPPINNLLPINNSLPPINIFPPNQ